jgi:hypothetical protein
LTVLNSRKRFFYRVCEDRNVSTFCVVVAAEVECCGGSAGVPDLLQQGPRVKSLRSISIGIIDVSPKS